jgi:hypothetical protein
LQLSDGDHVDAFPTLFEHVASLVESLLLCFTSDFPDLVSISCQGWQLGHGRGRWQIVDLTQTEGDNGAWGSQGSAPVGALGQLGAG